MNTQMTHRQRQSGAVSLFVVIFAALLMAVVTISFIQLMTKDQEQATASDLSQSAYDSAQAGVEDAKRLLLATKACGGSSASPCDGYKTALAANKCSTIADSGLFGTGASGSETMIQKDDDDRALNQAYTCVKIATDTADYQGKLDVQQSTMVPLIGTGEFNEVDLSWFSRDDVSSSAANLTFPDLTATHLPPLASWGSSSPSMLRTQLIQTGAGFNIDQFDANGAGGESNAATRFLYPTSLPGLNAVTMTSVARRSGSNSEAPVPVSCTTSFTSGDTYACTAKLALPKPIDGNTANRGAYLRLSALYNATHFSIKLRNSETNTDIKFNNVQPEVDATGRANSLFRRVKARVELTGAMVYPEAAVDITGNLCKNFFITDDPEQYDAQTSVCTP